MFWDTTVAPPGGRVVALDFETTGLSDDDRIVQIGAVASVNGVIVEEWSEHLNPQGVPMHPEAGAVNGLNDSFLASQEFTFADKCSRLAEFTENSLVLAHRMTFESRFWRNECSRAGFAPPSRAGLCTRVLSWVFTGGIAAGLRYGAKCLGVDTSDLDLDAHDALIDATASLRLYEVLRSGEYGESLQVNHDKHIGPDMFRDWNLTRDEELEYLVAVAKRDL